MVRTILDLCPIFSQPPFEKEKYLTRLSFAIWRSSDYILRRKKCQKDKILVCKNNVKLTDVQISEEININLLYSRSLATILDTHSGRYMWSNNVIFISIWLSVKCYRGVLRRKCRDLSFLRQAIPWLMFCLKGPKIEIEYKCALHSHCDMVAANFTICAHHQFMSVFLQW